MDPMIINKTHCTPEVHLNREKGHLSFSGNFNPAEGYSFYTPIIAWMKNYARDPQASTKVHIYVESITTSSAKFLVLIFRLLAKIQEKRKEVQLEWIYDNDDEIADWKDLLGHYAFPVRYHKIEESFV